MNETEPYFRELSARLFESLPQQEVLLLNYHGEASDFVRLNSSRVRSAGHVDQHSLHLDLIQDERVAGATLQLSGNAGQDLEQASYMLQRLREQLPHLPPDPYLNYATEPHNTREQPDNNLPASDAAIEHMIQSAGTEDLVGSLASGEIVFGFANSLGQFNWHSEFSFHADWSVHGSEDAAIKQSYHGYEWEPGYISNQLDYARETLDLLKRPAKQLSPGRYRVFLAPTALYELLQVLGPDGFSLKQHRTAQTSLLRLRRGEDALNSKVTLLEDHAGGRTPRFTPAGFIKPDQVELVCAGEFQDTLAGARSAREYDECVNSSLEQPASLEMLGGDLHQDKIMESLGTGIYIDNLWYCNLSDRRHCRITGLTRFACMWVENGEPVAPIPVMRFDESIYRILGEGLIALTAEHEHIFNSGTYEHRSTASANLPGALVDGFTLTL